MRKEDTGWWEEGEGEGIGRAGVDKEGFSPSPLVVVSVVGGVGGVVGVVGVVVVVDNSLISLHNSQSCSSPSPHFGKDKKPNEGIWKFTYSFFSFSCVFCCIFVIVCLVFLRVPTRKE